MTELAKAPRKADAAASLKVAGATYAEIARTLGYADDKQARDAVEKALAVQATPETKERLRTEQNMRYERLLRAAWYKAIDDSRTDQVTYIRAAREIVDRIVAVNGLAEPQEFVVRNPTDVQIQEWVARVRAIGLPDIVEAEIIDVDDVST